MAGGSAWQGGGGEDHGGRLFVPEGAGPLVSTRGEAGYRLLVLSSFSSFSLTQHFSIITDSNFSFPVIYPSHSHKNKHIKCYSTEKDELTVHM